MNGMSILLLPSPFARRFGIKSTHFGNEQYRNQEGKATRKRNSYQKVINCPSEPRRLIFVYGDAIFALPEAFFVGYSGAIFERLSNPFLLPTTAQNMHVFLLKLPLR